MNVKLYNCRVFREFHCYKAITDVSVHYSDFVDTFHDVVFFFDNTGRLLNDCDTTIGNSADTGSFDYPVVTLWQLGVGKRVVALTKEKYHDFASYPFPTASSMAVLQKASDSECEQLSRDLERFNIKCAIDAALAAKDKQLFTELVEKEGWYL